MTRLPTGLLPRKLKATVITDASYCPRTRAGGWAAWITSDEGRTQHAGCFKDLAKTPTEAELWAMLNGIWLAYEAGATEILVQSDCTGAVHLINSKCPETRLFKGVHIYARHVKGHTDIKEPRFYVNRWCDEEAKKHMRKQRALLDNESEYTTKGFY